MDERAGPEVARLAKRAAAPVDGVDRRPPPSPDRAEMDARSALRPSRGALIAKLLMLVVAVAALNGCTPATPPSTSTAGPAARAASPGVEPTPPAAPSPHSPAPGSVASVLYVEGIAITKTGTVTVDVGSRVTLRVVSDVADEVHLHGYDRRIDAAPSQEVGLTFTADTPGLFTVELENAQAELIEFEVV